MRSELYFYKTKDYFSLSTIREIIEDFQLRDIFEIKYLSVYMDLDKIKTYLYDDFDWNDTNLRENIIRYWMLIVWEQDDKWKKKYLQKIKSHEFSDFKNGSFWLITWWFRQKKNSREWVIWLQSTRLWFDFEYKEELANKFLEYSKYFASKYDIRETRLRIEDFQKDELNISYEWIINNSSALFNGIEYCFIFCSELVQAIWLEKILKAPAFKVELLPNGNVFIQSTQSLLDYVNWDKKKEKFNELKKLNDYLFSINVSDEIQYEIRQKWNTILEERNITLDDLIKL